MEKYTPGMPKFELHSHSTYSIGASALAEGIYRPAEMVEYAGRIGLSGIAITDHDTIKAWKEGREAARKAGILFIPGCEVSTSSGHVIGLGLNASIRPGLSVDETVEKIRAQGAIAIAAHPFDIIRGKGVMEEFRKADAVEIFNSLNSRMADGIAKRHARKAGMPFTGGSDAHTLEMIGNAQNMIDADSVDDLILKIKKGRVMVTGRPASLGSLVRWTRQRMTLYNDDLNLYINDNYSMLKAWASKGLLQKFIASESKKWEALAWVGLFLTTYYAAFRTAYEEIFLRLPHREHGIV